MAGFILTIYDARLSDISKRFVQAKVWSDNKRRKRAEKLLSDLEKLLNPTDI